MNVNALRNEFQTHFETVFRQSDASTEMLMPLAASQFGWGMPVKGPTSGLPGGKMVRPLLSLLVGRVLTGDHMSTMRVASCIHLIHELSLVLDDIADHDRERRHRPALWVQIGPARAMTAAVGLFVTAFDVLKPYLQNGIGAERFQQVYSEIIDGCMRLHDSQLLDLEWEAGKRPTLPECEDVACGRSALLECAVNASAALCTNDAKLIGQLRSYGKHVATSYNLYDDYRAIWGERDALGKPLMSDLRRGKQTYPIVAAYVGTTDAGRDRMDAHLVSGPVDDKDIQNLREVIDDTRAAEQTLAKADEHRQRALDLLVSFDDANGILLRGFTSSILAPQEEVRASSTDGGSEVVSGFPAGEHVHAMGTSRRSGS